uniref:Aminoadipate-semialdehyde dehydrogenase n=2 Tax=Nothobranchius kuhntae TaxID=321403 RepID=A0A1A8J1X2_NOTKU
MASRTLYGLVLAAASLHADRTAVTFCGGSGASDGSVSLLYRDLIQLSEELSRVLVKYCSPSSLIGLYCSDDLLVPVWILGILQSDAAYVPLDPEAPGFVAAKVMSQCGIKYCAVTNGLVQQFQASLMEYITMEICVELPKFRVTLMQIESRPVAKGTDQVRAQTVDVPGYKGLAYVLHTSGTTGAPKTISAGDVVFLASPLTFDPSVVDIFLALSSGAQLLIVPMVMKKMPNRLARLLFKDHRTTVLQVTPTLLMRFGPRILQQDVLSSSSSVRVLALGGEACPPPALLSSWRHKDNKTCIYNIYGVTEVSCWACCYKIPESLLLSINPPSSVPLGAPLMETVVEVRDEHGCIVSEGEGQVFIGGEDRVCLLDGEDTAVPGTKRATGDWVTVKDNQLYYLGRRDRIIKRNGKRLNLDSLQQLILSLPQVQACAVGLYEGLRLLAFVVSSAAGDQMAASAFPSGSAQPDADVTSLILKQLSLLLPSHSVPDALVLVPELSLTPHGKVDMEALMRTYSRQRGLRFSQAGDLKETLLTGWQEALGLPGDVSIDEQSNFLFAGGDSLKALHLCEDILSSMGVSSSNLLEIILDGTFSDVLHHLTWLVPPEESSTSIAKSKKRPASPPTGIIGKRAHKSTEMEEEKLGFKVVRRASEVMEVNTRKADRTETLQVFGGKDLSRSANMSLSLSWSSDTGRCVDASPVIVLRDNQRSDVPKATVLIGSHSHRVQALDLVSGNLLWERVLGDRIEASAAVSRCGSLVVVGCYDGCVYFLCSDSGETRWLFKTGNAVKSSPAVDPVSGLVVVGSHDGHVYALNPQLQLCVWKHHCGGGAVFSSPHLLATHRRLYAASLGGQLLCLDLDSGHVVWSYCRDTPFFSSPNSFCGHVVIGSVDGNICCLRDTGELLWQFLTEGPVFSSPCFVPEQQTLLCGSHDGRLYCLNCADGSLVWTFQTTGKVYSTPCVFDGFAAGQKGVLVGVASTDGTIWILDVRDGQIVTSHTLPGEVFSSPVVWGNILVIGCRNDYVYCLNLKSEPKDV